MERSPCRSRFSGRTCGLWGAYAGVVCFWMTAVQGKDSYWSSSWRTAACGKDLCWSRGKVWGVRNGRLELLCTECSPPFTILPVPLGGGGISSRKEGVKLSLGRRGGRGKCLSFVFSPVWNSESNSESASDTDTPRKRQLNTIPIFPFSPLIYPIFN